eukprot:13955537-Heterocapsa_arctica.AAC.1
MATRTPRHGHHRTHGIIYSALLKVNRICLCALASQTSRPIHPPETSKQSHTITEHIASHVAMVSQR